jgi:hypothetical protein
MSTRAVRSAGFVVAAISFMMPFMTVSCSAAKLTFTGIDLSIGRTIEEPQLFGPAKEHRVPPEPLALAALAAAAAGAGVALVDRDPTRMASAALAAAGGLSLLGLKNKVDREAQQQAFGLITVSYELGYWIALSGYAAAFLINLKLRWPPVARRMSQRSAPSADGPTPQPPAGQHFTPPRSGVPKNFCGHCGVRREASAVFCPNCGISLAEIDPQVHADASR